MLKDEEKQEFKAKTNDFLRDYTKIYKKSLILIPDEFLELFFELIINFVNLNFDTVLEKFNVFSDTMESEMLESSIDYIEACAFVSETPIRNEDAYKKKGGQYIKYKTIPKWHHYAWDMIK